MAAAPVSRLFSLEISANSWTPRQHRLLGPGDCFFWTWQICSPLHNPVGRLEEKFKMHDVEVVQQNSAVSMTNTILSHQIGRTDDDDDRAP